MWTWVRNRSAVSQRFSFESYMLEQISVNGWGWGWALWCSWATAYYTHISYWSFGTILLLISFLFTYLVRQWMLHSWGADIPASCGGHLDGILGSWFNLTPISLLGAMFWGAKEQMEDHSAFQKKKMNRRLQNCFQYYICNFICKTGETSDL